jgi:hypothetical protein
MIYNRLFIAIILALVFRTGNAAIATEVIYAAISSQGVKAFDVSGNQLRHYPTISATRLAVDSIGSLYVTNALGCCVIQYDPNGVFANAFIPTPVPGKVTITGGIVIGPDSNLYLGVGTEMPLSRIERFELDGTSLGIFAATGRNIDTELAFDAVGTLYAGSSGIKKYDPNGAFLGEVPVTVFDFALDSIGKIYATNSSGNVRIYSATGQFFNAFNPGFTAFAIALDSNDIIYVGGTASSSFRQPIIRKYRTDGTALGDLVALPAGPGTDVPVTDLVIVNLVPEPSGFLLAICAFATVPLVWRRRAINRCC